MKTQSHRQQIKVEPYEDGPAGKWWVLRTSGGAFGYVRGTRSEAARAARARMRRDGVA